MNMSNKEIKEVAEKFIDDMKVHGKIKVIDGYNKYEEDRVVTSRYGVRVTDRWLYAYRRLGIYKTPDDWTGCGRLEKGDILDYLGFTVRGFRLVHIPNKILLRLGGLDKYEESRNPKHVFWVKTGCGILQPKLANRTGCIVKYYIWRCKHG